MKQYTTATSTEADRLGTIWSIIEARKSLPAVIVVTSATKADDTGSVARGLAQAAHAAGQRAGYLRLAATGREPVVNGSYASLSLDTHASQRENFDNALASWRTLYDVVVVDAAPMGSEALAAHAMRVSDTVIIGVCDQRRVVSADRKLALLLRDLGACVTGVVMTAPSATTDKVRVLQAKPSLRPAAQQ